MNPENIIFEEFFKQSWLFISKKLDNDEKNLLIQELLKYINNIKIELEVKKYLFGIISFKPHLVNLKINEIVFKNIVQKYYEICCDYIGSVETDKFFSFAIKKCSDLPESFEFNPSRLFN